MTVTAATTAELRRKRDEVVGADLVELRLDTVSDPDVAGALAGRRLPVIVTCRPHVGRRSVRGSEDERRQILREALARGAEYVDIEWKANFTDLCRRPPAAASSSRRTTSTACRADLTRTGAGDARDRRGSRQAGRQDVAPQRLPAAARSRRADRAGRARVLIGMGECGLATRVLAQKIRIAVDVCRRSAARRTGDACRVARGVPVPRDHARPRTIYGLVGSPMSHSVSPAMHNAAFGATRLDAVYLPFPAVDADDFVTFGRAIGLKGASVTIPFKVALFDQMDEVYAVARRIGAINTMRAMDGRWIGGNTDAAGFLSPLRDRVELNGARVAVLGAGGAARAVAVALARARRSVTIYARESR